jgi:hypothetical protein
MTPLDELVASTCAVALARAKAGELLGPHDLMAIFHLKPSRFYELKQRGEFDRFLVHRPIAGRAAYAGVLVYRHVTGDAVEAPSTFSRKRGAR